MAARASVMLQKGRPVRRASVFPPASSCTAVERTASAPSWKE